MNMSRHNMFKRSAISVAIVAVTITATSCNAAPMPKQAETKEIKINFSCVTAKKENFDIKVIVNNSTYKVAVDKEKEFTVETMNTSSPFYPMIHGFPSGVSDGKEYYTIGLSTCTKQI